MALGLHCARTLLALNLRFNLAVCGPASPDYAGLGFACIPLDPADAPLSRSLALGVAAAQAAGAEAVLVTLADMPLIPAAHFEALIARFDGDCIATSVNGTAMPPAIFGQCRFAELAQQSGDQGARGLLGSVPLVELDPQSALDVDRPGDLAEAARRLG